MIFGSTTSIIDEILDNAVATPWLKEKSKSMIQDWKWIEKHAGIIYRHGQTLEDWDYDDRLQYALVKDLIDQAMVEFENDEPEDWDEWEERQQEFLRAVSLRKRSY
jgi:hypothetical protein